MKVRRHLLVLLLAAVNGCGSPAARAARPLASSEWKASLDPPPRQIPYLVTVFQPVGTTHVAIGSGSIVHSCKEHGTYVLTAYHCTSLPGVVRVWVYNFGRLVPSVDQKGLNCYRTERVYPLIEPRRDAMDDFWNGMKVFEQTWNRDFAVLRLKTRDLFHTVSLCTGSGCEPGLGTAVELQAVPPENYPHIHAFNWAKVFPVEAWRQGHSGGPILKEGSLIGLLSSSQGDTTLVQQAPTIATMRKTLEEAGLGFVLGPAVCSRPQSP
jgi:hypothetical protein